MLFEHLDVAFLVLTHLSRNEFSGTVNFTKLPRALEYLYLDGNRFVRDIDISALPKAMQHLYLHENAFDGEFGVGKLPEDLGDLRIDEPILLKLMQRFGSNNEEQENNLRSMLLGQLQSDGESAEEEWMSALDEFT